MANATPDQQATALKTLDWSIPVVGFFMLLMGYATFVSARDAIHTSNTPVSSMVAFVTAGFLVGCSLFPLLLLFGKLSIRMGISKPMDTTESHRVSGIGPGLAIIGTMLVTALVPHPSDSLGVFICAATTGVLLVIVGFCVYGQRKLKRQLIKGR